MSSAIVDKYIGESARLIREMFNYARDHQPCIIFMDEIDAIGKFANNLRDLVTNEFISLCDMCSVCFFQCCKNIYILVLVTTVVTTIIKT